MIKMTGETVERTLMSIINRYNETIGRGDGKSIAHTMDMWALWDAILCVRQSHGMHEFEFNHLGVKDQIEDMLRRRRLPVSVDLYYAMTEAYMLGAMSYEKQLAIAMDEAVNKEKYATCDFHDDSSLYPTTPIESEVK